MSQSEPSSPALGSREDFWGEDPDPDEPDRGHSDHGGVSFEEWVASQLLRQHPDATILCPSCLFDDDAAVELTEPQLYVEESGVERTAEVGDNNDDGNGDGEGNDTETVTWTELRYSDHRRHRVCPRCDQLCWGGTLADLPTAEFREVIEEFFGRFESTIPTFRQDDLLEHAMERKADGKDDEENLEALFTELKFEDQDEELFDEH